jgi:hypothetical protein
VARYELNGFVQLLALPRRDQVALRLDYATLHATLASIEGRKRLPEGIPATVGFGAKGPVTLDPTGGLAEVSFSVTYPELIAFRRFCTKSAAGHLPAPVAVTGQAGLGYLLDRAKGEILLHGVGVIRVPVFETPVLAELGCFCVCPDDATKPKCRTICLSVKVASDALGTPVLSDDRVKAIVAEINKIWGCSSPGQCCLQFELKKIAHPGHDKLKDPVKVNWTGTSDEFKAAAKVDRDPDCYSLYFVKKLDTVGGPAGRAILGQTKFDDEPAAIVQTADYPDATIGQLAAHELGHALGLARNGPDTEPKGVDKHSSRPDNLMEPNANIPARKLNLDQCKAALESKEMPIKISDTDCTSTPAET